MKGSDRKTNLASVIVQSIKNSKTFSFLNDLGVYPTF